MEGNGPIENSGNSNSGNPLYSGDNNQSSDQNVKSQNSGEVLQNASLEASREVLRELRQDASIVRNEPAGEQRQTDLVRVSNNIKDLSATVNSLVGTSEDAQRFAACCNRIVNKLDTLSNADPDTRKAVAALFDQLQTNPATADIANLLTKKRNQNA